jgi:hypothetical protein
MDDVENDKKQLTPKLKELIWMDSVLTNSCRAILQGMDEQELELRVMQLEEKLKTGVLISK